MAKPWNEYKPFMNRDYNTIWELGRMIYDQYKQDHPLEELDEVTSIQNEGIPVVARWLFKNPLIDMSKGVWIEFINQFMQHYLNRVVSNTNPYVWKTQLMYELVKYKDFIETNASKFYENINEMGSVVTNTGSSDNTSSNTSNMTSNNQSDNSSISNVENSNQSNTTGTSGNKTTNSTTGSNTNKGTNIADTLSNTESTVKNTGNNTTTSTQTLNTTNATTGESSNTSNGTTANTSTNYSRNLYSDTPQSIVNQATTGSPETMTWKYATNLTDNHGNTTDNATSENTSKDTSKSTTTNTGSNATDTTNAINTTATTKNTGTNQTNNSINMTATSTSEGTTLTSSDMTSSTTQSGTGKNTTTGSTKGTTTSNSEGTSTGSHTYTDKHEVINPYTLTKDKYEFYMKYMFKPIYQVLESLDKLFISLYVEDDRMGYLEWDSYMTITKYIRE